jgi:lipopolysaccharide transport system ATP-binding protein
MSAPVISIENLSKRYFIGDKINQSDGLRHTVERAIRRPFTRSLRGDKSTRRKSIEFWALNDLNLEVKPGEMLGVIGRNGAGKSTLLKLLSRITDPTTGRIRLRGRVASLLEVGTGFHPELTGRENIYLNGSILGMSRVEIRQRFDQIVAFAEIEQFLDTPVKRYSSGMYVRLAFAVAAHLEPDILIVDEVLAVGDADFQKKCLGRMEEASCKEGRTVIMVSHQIPAIQSLCKRSILMHHGRIVNDGETRHIIAEYLANGHVLAKCDLANRKDRQGYGEAIVTSIRMFNSNGREIHEAASGSEVIIRVSYQVKSSLILRNCTLCLTFYKELECYFGLSTALTSREELQIAGHGQIDFVIPSWPLTGGSYRVDSYLSSCSQVQDLVSDAVYLQTVDGDFYGTGRICHSSHWRNFVMIPHHWQHAVDAQVHGKDVK